MRLSIYQLLFLSAAMLLLAACSTVEAAPLPSATPYPPGVTPTAPGFIILGVSATPPPLVVEICDPFATEQANSDCNGTPTPTALIDLLPTGAAASALETAAGSLPPTPTVTALPPSATPTATLPAPPTGDDWKSLPILPTLSANAIAIYQKGIEMGNDPYAFAKVGDCQNVASMFLAAFEKNNYYRLGETYAYLQETIDWYRGSFERESLAVKGGFNAAAVLSPLRADPELCEDGENPLSCEYRALNPSFALISMETWWAGAPENYEKYMRQIIEYSIAEGVLPILATKADNLEGEYQINVILAKLAWEYDIPLWNFWAAVNPLANGGLQEDGFHLTFDYNYFDDPNVLKSAWPQRNLTALQVIDAVRRTVAGQPLVPAPTPQP